MASTATAASAAAAAAATAVAPCVTAAASAAKVVVNLVVAADERGGIGKDGKLPWDLPSDMAFFRDVTSKTDDATKVNAVIMGRKTWASIPAKHRPLRKRLNVVLSTSPTVADDEGIPADVLVASSLSHAVDLLSTPERRAAVERVFVIGGSAAFAEALTSPGIVCDTVYLTRLFKAFECDVFLASIDDDKFALQAWKPRQDENGIPFQFRTYVNRVLHRLERSPRPSAPLFTPPGAHEELQYLDAIRDIITSGVVRDDRTGVGTISKFGVQMRFSLADDVLPLLTTKRVFWRGVAEELLWFISGNTSARALQEKGVHIWDGNASREFLDKVGLSHREEGDLGPVYGFQWRHFGAAYTDMRADYTGAGVDQLAEVIHKIRTNPSDRRIILSAWNPAALRDMALPPCHMFAQFYVHAGALSCCMYQRSGDMGLGVPFNVASYALLTRLIAQVTGTTAAEFVHVIGDAHVYKNHVEPLMQQLERTPRPFPRLRIDPSVTRIEDFRYEHLTVEGYDPHATIKMEMAV